MSTVSWDETKRRAEETRRAAGHHVRTDAGNLDTVSVSVLRAYVEALGGKLKVTAEFDDSTYLVA